MTKHIYRCETCNQTRLGKCPATNICANSINDTAAIYRVTEIFGCASHSAADEKRVKTEQLLEVIKSSCNDTIECPLRSEAKELADQILYFIRVFGVDEK